MATKSKGSSIFERAEKALNDGTASGCAKLIRELEQLEASERDAWESSAPPSSELRHRPDGGSYTSPVPAGARYQAAADAGDQEAVNALASEHAMLQSRRDRIIALRKQLEARRKAAADEEAREAAPGRCEQLVGEIDDALDRAEAAAAEYQAARAALEGLEHELVEQRKLADDDAPALSLEQFARLGTALAHKLERHVTPTSDIGGRDTTSRHLFASKQRALELANALLPPPASSFLDKIRAVVSRVSSADLDANRDRGATPAEVQRRVTEWRREQVRLLAEGKVDEAKRLGPPRYEPGAHGRPIIRPDEAA